MPLWTWLSDRVEPARRYAKLLNVAFKPPDEKSSIRMIDEVAKSKSKPSLLKQLIGRRKP